MAGDNKAGNPQNPPQDPPQEPQIPPEEDLEPTEGTLKIDELFGVKMPGAKDKLDENRREVKFYPETRSLHEIANASLMAVDDNGNQYTDPDRIQAELSKKGRRLFLFDPDGEPPYALENRKGVIYCSDQRISSHNQLPGTVFIPAGSLKTDVIIGGSSPKRVKEVNEKYKKANQEYEVAAATNGYWKLKAQLEELKKNEPKPKEKKPGKKPEFSWGSRIRRWAYKIITLGQGETNAYRKYQADLAKYNERDKRYNDALEKIKPAQEEYLKEKTKLENELKEVEEKISPQREALEQAEQNMNRIVKGHIKDRSNGAQKVRDYRDNLEVKMEGIADLNKKGRIDRENIFANTWLKKNACEGKDFLDSEARNALVDYLTSKMVEDKLLSQTMSDDLDSRTKDEDEHLLRSLNNGTAAEQLRNSQEYQDVVREAELMGESIDPEALYTEITERIASKAKEVKTPVGKLEQAKEQLIDGFGKKPLTEDCAPQIMGLNKLNEAIRIAKSNPKYGIRDAYIVISDLYVEPDKQESIMTNVPSAADTRNIIKSLEGQQNGKKLSLDEMTKLVNDTRQVQKNDALQGSRNLQI